MQIRTRGLWWAPLVLALVVGCGDDDNTNDNQNNNNNGNDAPAVCGNGQVEAGEQCDDGADNSDTAPDACRANCRSHFCGDGVVDTEEGCDQGAQNSDFAPNACRTSCQWFSCGDGVLDTDASPVEECDEGADNSDTEPGACRTSCTLAACGDGVYDAGQICFEYHDVAQPSGLFYPIDTDDDGIDDLVGQSQNIMTMIQVVKNDGVSLARGRGFIVPFYPQPMVESGELLGAGQGQVVVPGSRRAILTTTESNGDLRLPAAYRLPLESPGSVVYGLPVGVTLPSGDRVVVVIEPMAQHVCTIPLDAHDHFDHAARFCVSAELSDWAIGVDGERGGRLKLLPTTAGTPAIVGYSDFGNQVNVLRLDAQGRFVSRSVYEHTHFGGYLVTHASRTAPSAWHLVEVVITQVINAMEFSRAEIRAWDPGAQDFSATPVTRSLVGTPQDLYENMPAAASVVMGDFGGSGDWQDLLLQDQRPGGVLYTHSSSGYSELSCQLATSVRDLVALELDGQSGTDLVEGYMSSSPALGVYTGFTASKCGAMPDVIRSLSAEPSQLEVADVDGDGTPEVVFSQHLVANGLESLGILDGASASIELLPVGQEVSTLMPFPRPGAGAGADLLFGLGSYDSGGNIIGLVRREGSHYVTALPVQAGGVEFDAVVGFRFVTDVDGDHQADLVLFETDNPLAHVFTGPYTAPQGFVSEASYALPYIPGMAAMGDLDGDGNPEIVTIRSNPVDPVDEPDDLVTVLPNDQGAFDASPLQVVAAFKPTVVLIADFNDDGYGDLATVHGTAGFVRVMLNDGSGTLDAQTFSGGTNYLAPGQAWTASAVDLDGDGILDLVASTPAHGNGPLWLRGRGDGTFHDAVDLPLTASEFTVLTGHLTSDAFMDLVVVSTATTESPFEFETVVLRGRP